MATYAAALQAKVGPPATSGVTINGSDTTGILTITGPTNNMTIGGNIVQSFSGTRTNFAVGSYTDPTTGNTTQAGIDGDSLTFVGATTNATPPNNTVANFTVSPTTSGESLTDYVTDIKAALKTNNVSGVTVTGANGVLSITGPSGLSITGPTGTGSAPIFNQDTLGTIIASSVTPTSAVSTLSTVTLPPASTTPATSSTNTLSPASPTISATAVICRGRGDGGFREQPSCNLQLRATGRNNNEHLYFCSDRHYQWQHEYEDHRANRGNPRHKHRHRHAD